jgi:hypothetical protein
MLTRLSAAFVAALALAVTGCGGDEGGGAGAGGSAAGIVPASTAVYVSVNADIDSDQWQQLLELIRKFPDHEKLEAAILEGLSDEGVDWRQDVEPALGPEVGIAVLLSGDTPIVIGLTQPDDKAKLDQLLDQGDEPAVTDELEGWTLVAEKQSDLDAFRTAREGGTLDDDETFGNAVDGLPGDSLATVYVGGEGVKKLLEEVSQGAASADQLGEFESFAAAVTSEDDGLRLEGVVRGVGETEAGEPYTPELLERVPAGSLAVLSFKGASGQVDRLRQNPALSQQLVEIERFLGVKLEEIAALFEGEGVLYVRSAAPFPEGTLYLTVEDEAAAKQTLETLTGKIEELAEGQVTVKQTTIEGIAATEVDAGPVSVYFATQDGLLAVTTSPAGLRNLRSLERSIEDDDEFKRAKDASGLGDETSGFFYFDLDALGPLIEGFAGVADEELPPEVIANLRPLDSFVVFAERDGDEFTIAGFLGVH